MGTLTKVMDRRHAKKLLDVGEIRFWNISFYREKDLSVIGDVTEGFGLFQYEGQELEWSTINPVYIWCSSLPNITASAVANFSSLANYDTTIKITDTDLFIERVKRALVEKHRCYLLLAQAVSYGKKESIDKDLLEKISWGDHLFQKPLSFRDESEFRIAIVDTRPDFISEEYLELTIGNCQDIVELE